MFKGCPYTFDRIVNNLSPTQIGKVKIKVTIERRVFFLLGVRWLSSIGRRRYSFDRVENNFESGPKKKRDNRVRNESAVYDEFINYFEGAIEFYWRGPLTLQLSKLPALWISNQL